MCEYPKWDRVAVDNNPNIKDVPVRHRDAGVRITKRIGKSKGCAGLEVVHCKSYRGSIIGP